MKDVYKLGQKTINFIATACSAPSITLQAMYAKIASVAAIAAVALSANAFYLDACIINCSAAAASAAGCSS